MLLYVTSLSEIKSPLYFKLYRFCAVKMGPYYLSGFCISRAEGSILYEIITCINEPLSEIEFVFYC